MATCNPQEQHSEGVKNIGIFLTIKTLIFRDINLETVCRQEKAFL